MSKRIALLKMERNLTKEDTYTLDAETTVDFEDKVNIFEEFLHPLQCNIYNIYKNI